MTPRDTKKCNPYNIFGSWTPPRNICPLQYFRAPAPPKRNPYSVFEPRRLNQKRQPLQRFGARSRQTATPKRRKQKRHPLQRFLLPDPEKATPTAFLGSGSTNSLKKIFPRLQAGPAWNQTPGGQKRDRGGGRDGPRPEDESFSHGASAKLMNPGPKDAAEII